MFPQLAIATHSLRLPLRASLKAAALLKAQGVRIDARLELKPRELSETGRREFAYFLKEVNLKLASFSFSLRRSLYDPVQLDARVSAIKEAIELAAKLPVSELCLKIGKIPEETDSAEFQTLHETFSDLAHCGNHYGISLVVTPMGEPPELLREFIESIQTGPVGIDFDPAIYALNEINPAEALRVLHQSVKQFTVRDAVRDFSGGGQEVPLGRGEVIWDEIVATLAEMNYRSWMVLQRQPSETSRAEIEQGINYLNHVSGELGWGSF